MDERDLYMLCGCIVLLAVVNIMHTSILKRQRDTLVHLDEDVTFLKFAVRTLEGKMSDE